MQERQSFLTNLSSMKRLKRRMKRSLAEEGLIGPCNRQKAKFIVKVAIESNENLIFRPFNKFSIAHASLQEPFEL